MKEKRNFEKGITLIALVITTIFSYDEKLKCSNNKGFPPTNNLTKIINFQIFER